MKLRMDIPVHHAQCVGQKIEHRSKVKVTENTTTTIWAITFEPEVVETSNRVIFSNLVNFVPIDLKIGTHIDWTYTI